ncbi:PREDICTED: uncharacterized protein LOC106116865 isoform X2 [Papilio xuthus]|nr:PREDICTED: uncharacterized protein LOC106116865 isoform X2 [Papilio xuthus]
MELASQEAMGDFSKPPLRDSSDTDSDISWYPNAFRNSPYCFQSADMDMSREYYEPGEGEVALQTGLQSGLQTGLECEWGRPRLANNLFVVTEETSSQLAIQEVKSEAGDDWDCNDMASM